MRLQYLSDLHFEFHADAGASFVESLEPSGVDVLVVAGDLAVAEGIGPALDRICARYTDSIVAYVHGNHEFYGSNREEVLAITRATCARNPNLRWLDGDVAQLGERRLLGAPMWFRKSAVPARVKLAMNDFHQIADFESWVYAENERALAFFERELREGDLVVTHYLPTQASVAPQYAGSPLNPFFVCDIEPLLRARRAALWVHGHTHSSVDVQLDATRVVCNPFGYVRYEENRDFRHDLVIDL